MILGTYMIVKNEQVLLGTCLESIKDLDEIVILDTGSTDNTAEVASKYNCEYIADKYKWNDNFAEARNEARKYAKADWFLIIDADDTLVGDVSKIKEAIKKHPEATVFGIKTVSKQNNAHHISVRLHQNIPEIYWKGAAHNYLTVASGPLIEGIEVHYGYSPAHKLDPDRTMRILIKHCEGHPNATRERYYLAREFYYRKNYVEALKHLVRYWRVATFAGEKADSKIMAARCAIGLNNTSDAWRYTFEALRINADISEAYKLLASLSGPNNKKHWLRMAETANNTQALFIRN